MPAGRGSRGPISSSVSFVFFGVYSSSAGNDGSRFVVTGCGGSSG